MMDIVVDSVKKLEELLEYSGCSDGGVILEVEPDAVNCQFEKGACMVAVFGGKCGVFTTFDPVRACTKISFMFGSPLDTPEVRGAACAIINVTTGFFCLVRALRPCNKSAHLTCRKKLAEEVAGKIVSFLGSAAQTEITSGLSVVSDYSQADVIFINADGLIEKTTGDIIIKYRKDKRIICVGPSTTGISRLYEIEHWCPFGCS